MKPILLPYGGPEPLLLEPADADIAIDARGPLGVKGAATGKLVTAAVTATKRLPPLAAHVVPGDRVAIALAGPIPDAAVVVEAIRGQLESAGVAADDIALLQAPPLDGMALRTADQPPLPAALMFDPGHESESAYLTSDADGNPLHLARVLVDADVVVAVGTRTWDASLGGPSFDGDLWPAFARTSARNDILRRLARTGRKGVAPIHDWARDIGWQLGVMASVRIVPGREGSIHAVEFGTPLSAARAALRDAAGWRPRLPGGARLAILSLAEPDGGLPALVRAVAAASKATHPEGTICVACRLSEPPGAVFTRWRQGVALAPLVMEALRSGDPALVADALSTRLFARALGDRRLVLLSDLEAGLIEDLEFGHAATPEVVERLAHRADSLVILHEAERMFPRPA